MLETERSSDEALRQPTFRRLYLGALEIDDKKKRLEACYIILLAGRLGLRTGEIQHVREEWVDWRRGEIAIPRHDPCGCMNCWIAAKRKASDDEEQLRDEIKEIIEDRIHDNTSRDIEEIVDEYLVDDDELPPELAKSEGVVTKTSDKGEDSDDDDRTAEEILYEERWQPKYERSARRVPFGQSKRLTAVIMEYLREFEYMEITQPTMNNRVTRAAEHAEGVNSDNITLRGLRATAATHYATYLRNPKALQDVIGWTRIETAARYLRRAGAFTTDVVYHAFDQASLKPAMYPEEPNTPFPLTGNPVPFMGEPVDPVSYDYEKRKDRAEATSDTARQLIHYRSSNPPDDIQYDPEEHAILTHEDLESDIVEDIDGRKVIKEPTLDEFISDHDRIRTDGSGELNSQRRFNSMEEYWHKSLPKKPDSIFTDDQGDQSSIKGVVQTFIAWFWGLVDTIDVRIQHYRSENDLPDRVERQYGRKQGESDSSDSTPMVAKLSIGFNIWQACLIAYLFVFVRTETYWNPLTGEWNFEPVMLPLLALTFYVSYKLPKVGSLEEIFK